MKETNFKFGITERGDGGLDLSWEDRIHAVEAAIIISKSASSELKDKLLKYSNKVIYHATCTGLGNTKFEPNVPSIDDKFEHIKQLIYEGFPKNQIVVRIDPLFPMMFVEKINKFLGINYISNIEYILNLTEALGITRVRYSYLDCYPHVLDRLKKLNNEFVFNQPWCFNYFNEIQLEKMKPELTYEVCCEDFALIPKWQKLGCISNEDLRILKKYNDFKFTGFSKQRYGCLCPGNKLELLNSPYRCNHQCVYCYWKDKK